MHLWSTVVAGKHDGVTVFQRSRHKRLIRRNVLVVASQGPLVILFGKIRQNLGGKTRSGITDTQSRRHTDNKLTTGFSHSEHKKEFIKRFSWSTPKSLRRGYIDKGNATL